MTIEPWDTIAQKLPTAMATGAGPDIATPDYNVGTIREYIKEGLIAPIDSLLGSGPDQVPASVIPPAVKAAFTINGHLYAAPANWAPWSSTTTRPCLPRLGSPVRHDHDPAPAGRGQADNQVRLTGHPVRHGHRDHSTIAMWPIFIWANGGNILNATVART